ncbi:bifunctional DNA primase/polymerase [Aurantimonas endophytica]|uniref:DNA primase/polymerase bifunctional N-terminal domain-containing protein n=1 Tax=Aurantimonas endophytica TaxID=1522175 RepID=A0A7W6HG07_9HYPH|nr:bifunctional DNA primase/polymerase [Aurantimonas endophytica]MBB4004463.1 hypothetical protein [Aurantimonas endophytica]MCO6405299.1 DUF3987 domain-containing protein [Aurantimonas endophytica]
MGLGSPPPSTGEPANLAVALSLAAKGFAVFPVQSGGEKAKAPMPFFRWRQESTSESSTIREWWRKWPDAAPALDVGKSGLFVIDADRHDPEHDGVEAWSDLMAGESASPEGIPIVATPNDGNHWIFRQDGGLGNRKGRLPKGVDVRGDGGYIVAPGAIMADGRRYEVHGDPADAPPVPDWLTKWLERGGGEAAEDNSAVPDTRDFRVSQTPSTTTSDTTSDEIIELLGYVPADCGYDEWVQALMAVHAAKGGSGEGLSIADTWSSAGSKYKAGEVAKKWRSFRSAGVNGATLAALAKQYGADLSAIRIAHMPPEDPAALDHGRSVIAALSRSRRLIEHPDGTVTDEDGVVVESAAPPPATTAPTNPSSFPPGLVGQIAQWICDTSRRPQPGLALGAALTIVGTAAGRQFVGPTGSATHLYVLGLAPTGAGKDFALQQIERILAAARMSHHIGPSEFISMPAVVNFLVRSPLSLCAMDEFGDFMARIGNKRASGFERSISKVLRTMWGKSFANYTTPEWAGKEAATIHAPAISIYGASTPEQFWRAMEGGSVEDGTLNRFLLVGSDGRPDERDPALDPATVPAAIVDALLAIYERSGAMQATLRNQADMDPTPNRQVVAWAGADAKAVYDQFSKRVEAKLSDPDSASFYARTAEMALRIATIVAVGRGPFSAMNVVTADDMEFGKVVAMSSAETMITGAADYMADSDNQASAQRVRRIIKDRGGRVQHKVVLKAMQHSMKARDLRDLLGAMVDAEELELQKVKPASGGPEVTWYRVLE